MGEGSYECRTQTDRRIFFWNFLKNMEAKYIYPKIPIWISISKNHHVQDNPRGKRCITIPGGNIGVPIRNRSVFSSLVSNYRKQLHMLQKKGYEIIKVLGNELFSQLKNRTKVFTSCFLLSLARKMLVSPWLLSCLKVSHTKFSPRESQTHCH